MMSPLYESPMHLYFKCSLGKARCSYSMHTVWFPTGCYLPHYNTKNTNVMHRNIDPLDGCKRQQIWELSKQNNKIVFSLEKNTEKNFRKQDS